MLALATTVLLVLTTSTPGEVAIQDELLSPLGQGFSYVPSPAPVDLVTVGPAGSRVAVYRRGEAGPKFDEIMVTQPTPEGGGGIAVVFSPDGSRFAYVGRKRGEFTLIVDGAEVVKGQLDGPYDMIEGVGFTADSQHVFYRLRQTDESGVAPWRFVMDGESSPALATNEFQVLLSPVGKGYALVGTLMEGRQRVFVRDGAVVDIPATSFVYRHDGRLFTLEHDAATNESVLRLDGDELFRGNYVVQEIVPAPAGDGWVLIGTSRSRGQATHVVVNGEELDCQVSSMVGSQRVWFSDDGERWAVIAQPQTGRQYAIVDGQEHDEYASIHEFGFSSDGTRVAYWGRSPSGFHFVIDGEEQDGISGSKTRPVFGGGAHVGWTEQSLNPVRLSVLLDGQRYVGSQHLAHHTLGLSPDGTRMAVMDGGTVVELTAAGVTRHDAVKVVSSRAPGHGGHRGMPSGYLFSPDGRILAFLGKDAQSGVQSVYFNGKRAFDAPGAGVLRAGFSPDAEHFFIVMVSSAERTLYVDGEPVMRYGPQPFEEDASMWHVDDAGVLRFMIADGEGIKRVTVTPSADRSVGTLVGG